MFNLEKAISDWRSLLRSSGLAESDSAELESHLRDGIDELSTVSLSTEESFLIARFRLGNICNLANEFSKLRRSGFDARLPPMTCVDRHGAEEGQVYAGFSRRLMAFIFDLCTYLIAGTFLLYTVSLLPLAWAVLTVVLLTFLFVTYVISFTYCHGGTLGKILAGIRISRPDGSALSFRQSLQRNAPCLFFVLYEMVFYIQMLDGAGKGASELIVWGQLTVGVLSALWLTGSALCLARDDHSRSLPDYLGDTVVVDEKYASINAAGDGPDFTTHSVLI